MIRINVEILSKEIHNPLLKIILAPLIFIIGGSLLAAVIVLSIPAHFILISLGRRGFIHGIKKRSYRVAKVELEEVKTITYF